MLNAALAELDESSADASCLQALNLAADRLSALLSSGAHMPPHLLCQVAFYISEIVSLFVKPCLCFFLTMYLAASGMCV